MNKFLGLGVILVMLVGIVAGVVLTQRQQLLKSKASEDFVGKPCSFDGDIPEAKACITSCPAGTTGTAGGHNYCVYSDDGNHTFSSCQPETQAETCIKSSTGDTGGGTSCQDEFKYNQCTACNKSEPVYQNTCTGAYTTGPVQSDLACGSFCTGGDTGNVGTGTGGVCSGNLTASCNPATLSTSWNIEPKFGCNVFLESPDGQNSSQLSSNCSSSWSGSNIPGIGAVTNGTYRLFVSNGDPNGSCYNKSVASVAVNCSTGGTFCKANFFDASACRICASDGSHWIASFGPNKGSTEWCACAKKEASFTTDPQYSICPGGGPTATGGTGVTDAAEFEGIVFKQNNLPVTYLTAGQTYDVEITMSNRDKKVPSYQGPTWTAGDLSKINITDLEKNKIANPGYFLGFPLAGDTGAGDFKINVNTAGTDLSINALWQIQWKDPAKLRISLDKNVPPCISGNVTATCSNTFKTKITPQRDGTTPHTFYWGMVHEGVNWFGAQYASPIEVAAAGTAAPVCAQVPTKAKNSTTGECKEFPTSCLDIGWVADSKCTDVSVCAQVPTKAKNSTTGECKEFPTSCLDAGWVAYPNCTVSSTPTTAIQYRIAEGNTPDDAKFNLGSLNYDHQYQPSSSTSSQRFSYEFSSLKTNDVRYIAIQYQKGNLHTVAYVTKVIRFVGNAPVITVANCKFSPTGDGTDVTITGSGFTNDQGTVTVGSKTLDSISKWTDNQIIGKVKEKLDGKQNIKVTTPGGQVTSGANDRCIVNTTSVDFTAKLQCKQADLSASNVEVKIFENTVGSDPTKPLYRQKITLDSKGRPQTDFNPKFEVDKEYVVQIKAPNSLSQLFKFRATEGSTIIEKPVLLLVGDIAGQDGPDGQVNSKDYSALVSQWSPAKDVTRLADFNSDKRVNNFDYSCIKDSIRLNEKDKVFSAPKRILEASPSSSTSSATDTPTI